MSQKQSKYVWSFNKFLPQFGEPLSAEQYLAQNNSKYTVCQYYTFLERQYSTPLKHILEDIYYDLNIPIDVINIITVYNSGGIIYDYTKSFEEYTTGNVVYITPIIFGYIETFLFFSLFIMMYLMHFQFKFSIFADPNAYQRMNNVLLLIAVIYSLFLCLHTICVFISFHQCKQYEVILRHFKRSLYSNKNFTNHIRMIDMKEQTQHDDDDDDEDTTQTNDSESHTIPENACLRGNGRAMYTLDISEFEDGAMVPHDKSDDHSDETEQSTTSSSGIMDRWQWNETYKEKQQNEFLSILNPSNNSFAYVAYQRWLNVKKLELENDSFTRSKSALVLNLSKYWLTSYFTLIIILIFVIPNSVYLYFAFVLTLFVMYYCYLRTIKKLDHSAALKKVLYLFCSFVIGTIITLIIIFTTEDPSGANGGNVPSSASSPSTGATDDDTTNTAEHMDGGAHGMESGAMNAENGGVTFWIFDVIFPILEGVFALLYSYITVSLVYKIAKHGHQGYHLWLCCVNAFGFWLLTFWIPSWKITEISILCTALLLVSCYLYLQQISHRIMTGLNKHDYITKHCAHNPKEWLKNEIKQLFVPYTYCQCE
eukprot:5094_1